MTRTILVVDDELHLRTMLGEYLTEQGFLVATASNGREALAAARRSPPDLILLDVMMPELDGFEFIRAYRRERDTPIILLTARPDETDKVVGLELGADDYVTKPFGMRELLARVRAVLRRTSEAVPAGEILRASNILLDRSLRRVEVAGTETELTPTEFELLAVLMATPGRVYSRTQLLDKLHSFTPEGVERTIDVHVRNLRAKIEADPRTPRYIETVFGIGYRFARES